MKYLVLIGFLTAFGASEVSAGSAHDYQCKGYCHGYTPKNPGGCSCPPGFPPK